jgi:hypothetical protein
VTLAGVEVRSRRIGDSEWARSALLAGAPIEIQATGGPPVPALASLFSVYDENQAEIVLVGPDRDDLVYRCRSRASAWRLDQPDVRLAGAMRGIADGSALAVRTWLPTPGNRCLEVNGQAACGLGMTVGSGWGLLFYAEWFPSWLRLLLTMCWAGALALPLGFLVRPRWESIVAVLIAGAALALVPSALDLLSTSPLEWLGANLGLTGGAVAARLAGRRPARDSGRSAAGG